jgi:4-hydroxy-3-methylbut-2-enyl diphosphate reductase IspH
LISSGASCPDAMVEAVVEKIAALRNDTEKLNLYKEKILQVN